MVELCERGDNMEWELTDDEIVNAPANDRFGMDRERSIAKAAQKKLVEWGEEPCREHSSPCRRVCFTCWQELRKGVGLK